MQQVVDKTYAIFDGSGFDFRIAGCKRYVQCFGMVERQCNGVSNTCMNRLQCLLYSFNVSGVGKRYVLIHDHTDCRYNLTITDLRNRLGAETVETIECLKMVG